MTTDTATYADEYGWLAPDIEALGFELADQGRGWTEYTDDGDLCVEVFWRDPPLMWLEHDGVTTKFYDFNELRARVETIRRGSKAA